MKFFNKKITTRDFKIFSYEFPEGVFIGYQSSQDIDEHKRFFANYSYYLFPLSDLLVKYDFVKAKLLRTFTINNYKGFEKSLEEIYKNIREVIDENGYKPYSLLNKNLKLYGFDDDVIKKQKVNLEIFFGDYDEEKYKKKFFNRFFNNCGYNMYRYDEEDRKKRNSL